MKPENYEKIKELMEKRIVFSSKVEKLEFAVFSQVDFTNDNATASVRITDEVMKDENVKVDDFKKMVVTFLKRKLAAIDEELKDL